MSARWKREGVGWEAAFCGPCVERPLVNGWLRTGPDTMPRAQRSKLHSLIAYWSLVRAGLHEYFPKVSRAVWLAQPGGHWHWTLGTHYNPKRIEKIAYADSPFLAWVPKLSSFSEAR